MTYFWLHVNTATEKLLDQLWYATARTPQKFLAALMRGLLLEGLYRGIAVKLEPELFRRCQSISIDIHFLLANFTDTIIRSYSSNSGFKLALFFAPIPLPQML